MLEIRQTLLDEEKIVKLELEQTQKKIHVSGVFWKSG